MLRKKDLIRKGSYIPAKNEESNPSVRQINGGAEKCFSTVRETYQWALIALHTLMLDMKVYSCVSEWDPSNILLLTTKAMTSHDIACYELSAPTRSNIRNGSKSIFQFFSNQFSNYIYSINPDCMVIFKNQYQSFLCEKYVEKSGRNKYFCVVYLWASQYLILIEK